MEQTNKQKDGRCGRFQHADVYALRCCKHLMTQTGASTTINSCAPIKRKMNKLFSILLFISSLQFNVNGQIYLHDFGTTTITAHPYTVAPGTFDSNLSNSSWSNSTGVWTSFAGATGQAISLSNSSGTPTITLTFDVNPGCSLDITAFDFWRQRSATGAQNWSMTINGTGVGSGTVPTTGAMIGSTPVSGMTGLTGTVTIVISLSGASGSGTFRLDNFTLAGNTSCGGSNTITTGVVSPTSFIVDCSIPTNGPGTVQFTSTGVFDPSNVYTVQLSDASGNFGTPTNIGTLNSSANVGTIVFTIPAAMPSGVNYMIRIISNNPVAIGTSAGPISITQSGVCIPQIPTSPGLIINEWSNGTAGSEEYYEFVVAGQCGESVDIRGFILDDNNGTFTDPTMYAAMTPTSGIAQGHFRFANHPQWSAVPVGSLIVIYNAAEPNPALPPDDPSDANNDSLYVVPHTNTLFESCTSIPVSYALGPPSNPGDSTYSPCTYITGGGWSGLGIRNAGDAIQVRNPDGSYYHGVSYGGVEITGGPHNLKLFSGSGSGMCGWFNDGDFFNISNWSSGPAGGANETPGLPNNLLNYEWLKLMRDTNAATCPITILPVEIIGFDGIKLESKNQLIWKTANELNASHFVIERSNDGYNWNQIGTVKAEGYSNEILTYTYDDSRFEVDMNYYRLIEFDVDGASEKYNKIVSIDNRKNSPNNLIGRYNLMGQPINEDFKGVQILLFQDGTTEKMVNF